MRDTRIPPTQCPDCGYVLEGALDPYGKAQPAPGALGICPRCSAVSVFDENLRLVPADQAGLNERDKAAVERIRKALKSARRMDWKTELSCIKVEGLACDITIEPRPHYCDRGNYIAKLHARMPLSMEVDGADGWPRYYFDLDRAKLECEAWLYKRGQAK